MESIKEARERKGLSQEHLAGSAEVGVRTVQRAEAGERISAENLLAICAVLGLTPERVSPEPPKASVVGTLPQVARVRKALDKALADAGERPSWRLADPTPRLLDALMNMGETLDEHGFDRAAALTARRSKSNVRFGVATIILGIFTFAMGAILAFETLLLPFDGLRLAFHSQRQVRFPVELLYIVPVLAMIEGIFFLLSTRFDRLVAPGKGSAILRKGIVESDLELRDVAQTRDALWLAAARKEGIAVKRVGLDLLTKVDFVESEDGAHSVVFTEGETRHRVDRLSDADLEAVRKRFQTRSARDWTLAVA